MSRFFRRSTDFFCCNVRIRTAALFPFNHQKSSSPKIVAFIGLRSTWVYKSMNSLQYHITQYNNQELTKCPVADIYRISDAMMESIVKVGEIWSNQDDTHSVQRGSSSQVWQEANLQQVQQKVLVFNPINSVQKQHHGCFMVRAETSGHVGLHHQPVYSGKDPENINKHT